MSKNIQLALLAGFYPALFFLSNNWHVFSIQQSVIMLIGASLFSFISIFATAYTFNYLVHILIHNISHDIRPETADPERTLIAPLLAVSSLLICIYLQRNTIASIEVQQTLLYIIIVAIVLFFSVFAYKNGIRIIVTFLTILTSLSLINLSIGLYTNIQTPVENWVFENKRIYEQIKFRHHPNVYLIIAESYPNKYALEAVYNIDNASFYEKLNELGFKINHSHYSNYHHTLSSLPSLFSMEHHFGHINIGNFDSVGGRRMLEGKAYNPVIDIFRSNQYKIQYLHEINILIPNGADVDYCYPAPSPWEALAIFLTHQNIIEPTIFSPHNSDVLGSMKKQIAKTSDSGEPYFSFIYFNFPQHSPRLKPHGYSNTIINQKLEAFRSNYDKNIDSANSHLFDFLKFIIDKNQDGIIILVGDHGSWGFRYKEDKHGKPISDRLFIIDHFGVLAGIRGPSELSDLMENGTIKSHVNLLRYVIAYLSNDEKILATKKPDDSYQNNTLLAIKDGNVLEHFIEIKQANE